MKDERFKFKGFYVNDQLVLEFTDIDDIEFDIQGQKYILQDFLGDLILAKLQSIDFTKKNFVYFRGLRNKKEIK